MNLSSEGAAAICARGEKALGTDDDVEIATADAHSEEVVLSNERDIATHVISVDDDTTLSPWTFRTFFLGIGLSTFGGVLGEFLRVRFQSSYLLLSTL